jgi:hypothetical protein
MRGLYARLVEDGGSEKEKDTVGVLRAEGKKRSVRTCSNFKPCDLIATTVCLYPSSFLTPIISTRPLGRIHPAIVTLLSE